MAADANHRISAGRGKFYSALRDQLVAHAEKTFELEAIEEDGQTYREVLEGLRDRSRSDKAQYEAELACPPLPRELAYLWRTFWRLSNRRGGNGFALNPISFTEIDAFCRLSGLRLAPWELSIVEELDNLYRKPKA